MRAFVVDVSEAEAELAADILFGLGAAAVEERRAGSGQVELWSHLGDGDEAIAAATEAMHPSWRWRLVELDPAIADSWRVHAAPVRLTDDIEIVPAWLDVDRSGSGAHRVLIDPGAAFGMGDHPTTVLTARRLIELLADRSVAAHPPSVLDVGSGSGVLAVIAAQQGAAPVVAIDHLPAAVEATAANAERNGVGGTVDASGRPLAEVSEEFDIVLANLLAPALVELAVDLVRVTRPGGVVVASGLLAGRFDHVAAALAPMAVTSITELDGWVAVELRRPG